MLLSFSIELYPYPNLGVFIFAVSLLASVCLYVGFSQFLSLSICLSVHLSLTNINTHAYTHAHTHINIICVNFLVFVCMSAIFLLVMLLTATMFLSFFLLVWMYVICNSAFFHDIKLMYSKNSPYYPL